MAGMFWVRAFLTELNAWQWLGILVARAPESYTKLAAQRLADRGYAQLLDLLPNESLEHD